MLETILTGLFYTVFAIQLIIGIISLYRIYFHKLRIDILHIEDRPVSIIICAWNELSGLKKILPQLYIQAHASFEIIVVDDRSTDGTYEFLIDERRKHDNLRIVRIDWTPDHLNSKKYALTLGLKAARNNLVLLTDADCYPNSIHWIKTMTSYFDRNTDFILGYSQYVKEPGMLNLFIRYETLQTAILYFSSAIGRDPYMGVGRNLAYKKDIFFDSKGFKGYYQIVGGDDDLFVNKHADTRNTKSVLDPEAIVYSSPKTSFSDFFKQKIRHLSVSKYYRLRHRIKLGVFTISKLLFWISFIWCMSLSEFDWPILVSAFIYFSFLTLQFYISSRKMGDQFEIYTVPLFDLLYVLYLSGFGVLALIRKRIPWI